MSTRTLSQRKLSTYRYNSTNAAPFDPGGSVSFSGGSNYLSTPTSSAFTFGTGDFCIEMWYKGVIDGYVFDTGINGTRIQLYAGLIYFFTSDGYEVHGSTSGWSSTTWYHFAMTRGGGYLRGYVNGTQVASTPHSGNLNDNKFNIGAYAGGGGVNGLISNFRVNKSLVYTGNFTVPTSKLTAISGTSLLTCQNTNSIVDNSANAFTITVNGSPSASSSNPFS